jgi:hypothetical protein
MTSAWIRTQDRKRNLIAAASTACVYALAFLSAWAFGLIVPTSLASTPSTIVVDLGGATGEGAVPLGLENAPDRPANGAPLGAAPLPAAGSSTASIPAQSQANATVASVGSASAAASKSVSAKTVPAKDAVALAAEQERAAQEAAAVQAAAATAAAASGPPKTRTFGSNPSGAPVATTNGSGFSPGVEGGMGTVTFRGSEMGNALATTFGASSGQVGRNIYVPVYLYMPLPSRIDDSIYRNIQAKGTFRSYYRQSGSEWVLISQAPLSQRGEFWTMLEAAGYDASTADFKTAQKLSPVVLEFAVGPLANGRAELVDVRLVSSSGSSDVDEAVIYGFRQASFFNKTENAVGGRFIYSF